MLQGVQGVIGNSAGDVTLSTEAGGGGTESIAGGFSKEDKAKIEEGERNSGGNRWPRQETIALLQIRSDMDVVFRDSSLKGPLWEEVSRKMAELGYHRSAKKCKEKFENVYKYHKRTRDGRASKADGKTYRFFDQLEALNNHPPLLPSLPPPTPARPQLPMAAVPISAVSTTNPPVVHQVTVPSVTNPLNVSPITVTPTVNPTTNPSQPAATTTIMTTTNPTNHSQTIAIQPSHRNMSGSFMSNSSSFSTSSDEEPERRGNRKRKWKDFFERLMKDVIEKQEEMQMKFLERMEKRERDRKMREEAWRVQEMARMNREHELLVQERSIAAAKDAALITFLQKMTEQQNPQNPNAPAAQPQSQMQQEVQQIPLPLLPPTQQSTQSAQLQQPPPQPPAAAAPPPVMKNIETPKTDNRNENFIPQGSSRWPKAEVQALIGLQKSLDVKYQETGPKGPLWEEVSAGMRKLRYNRSAKRCKEKWENINKYFKKVKESNKKRPEDSKTCPYFHQLEALYLEKAKNESSFSPALGMKPENPKVPIMARPEQQWQLPQNQQHGHGGQPDHQQAMEDQENEENNEEDEDIDDEDYDEDEDDDEGNSYEIVTTKAPSVADAIE